MGASWVPRQPRSRRGSRSTATASLQMPTFSRKLRIFFEWAWGMFFPTDITHLRFTRSRDVMQPPLE